MQRGRPRQINLFRQLDEKVEAEFRDLSREERLERVFELSEFQLELHRARRQFS